MVPQLALLQARPPPRTGDIPPFQVGTGMISREKGARTTLARGRGAVRRSALRRGIAAGPSCPPGASSRRPLLLRNITKMYCYQSKFQQFLTAVIGDNNTVNTSTVALNKSSQVSYTFNHLQGKQWNSFVKNIDRDMLALIIQ